MAGQDSMLDRLLAPKPQGDPLDEMLREDAQRRAAASLAASSGDPERTAKANRAARETGLPLSTAERQLPMIEREVSIKRALQDVQSSGYLSEWFSDPVRATVAKDDTAALKGLSDHFAGIWRNRDDRITASVRASRDASVARAANADGILDRGAALLRSGLSYVDAGLSRTGAALREWSANNPLPWTSEATTQNERAMARQLSTRARLLGEVSSAPIRGQTTWEGVKARPSAGNIFAFGAEQTVQSLPGMAAAALALPAYIASQAGNIGQQRAENNGRQDAAIGDVIAASPAAVASALLERVGIKGIFGSAGANVTTRIAKAAGKEAATEALQSDLEYAGGSVGTNKGFDAAEALDQMAAGGVGGAFGGGSIRGVQEAGGGVRQLVRGVFDRRQAAEESAFLDVLTEGAAATKLKQRDPEMLREFLAGLTEDTPVENVYLPADAVRQLYQDSYRDDPFFGDYAEQIEDALIHDGDVVIPTADLASRLAGTPAWEQLKAEARFSPGGVSRSEAEAFNGEVADLMTEAVERAADRLRTDAAAAEPRQKLYSSILTKLTDAQFTPDVARQYAELLTAREATRASRLGQELTGTELDGLDITRVLPEALRPIVATSELDLVIGAMRRGRNAQISSGGPTLLEWIASRGGIEDVGGDIASMGGDRWHRGKPGRRKLIRPSADRAQGAFLPSGAGARYGLDDTLQDAIDAGFFPELQRSGDVVGGADATTYDDKPDARALLDAIDDELRGTPRRAADAESDRVRELADELAQLLDQGGLDITTASDADIKNFVQRYQADTAEGRGYDQELIEGARPERGAGNFREARAAVSQFQGQPLTNAETGIVARVSRNAVDKMLSRKAVAKSTSARDHSLAVANADKLFANALLNETHADRRDDPSVEAVHRFVAPLINADGEVLAVKMTVKQFGGGQANQLYTIETIEVDEGGEARIGAIQPSPVQASASAQEPNVAPPGFTPKVASMLAEVKAAADGRSFDQFAGIRAKNAPLDDLQRAQDLEAAGADADTIKGETNWHRGDDGKWRWEIDDSGARLRDGEPRQAAVGDILPLSELIDHPALFEAYPGLANLPVEIVAGAGGRYTGKRIEIGERNLWEVRRPNNEGLGVILHEVQHVIQMWERFASGGPANAAGLRAVGFGEALDAEIARLRLEDGQAADTPAGWGAAGGLEESQIEGTAARNVYRRIAGEVEARNTQSRRDMSAEARRDAGERWTRDTTVADVLFPRRMLEQTYDSGARGRITFQNDKRVIELFAKADLSTLIHEAAGHDWLEQLQADAARAVEGDGNPAARQLFADWETVKAWFAANGHAIGEDGVIPVEAHEMWARGVERYVMEGKSPTPALRRVFDAFRSWLIAIYQVVDNLRSPITPEIREVMDRLIATDEELALAREEQRVSTMFESAEQAGMTGAEYEAYRQAAEDARSDAMDALLFRTMRAIRATRTAEYKSIEGGVRREVTEAVDARPVFRALAILRDRSRGTQLGRQWLIDTYGADALDQMPKSVPPIYVERGADADQIAEMAGFTTGDEMVRTLMGHEARRREMREAGDKRSVRQSVIDDEVRSIMLDRYGDPLNDGTIEREARELIHNDRQGDVIAAELRALQRLRRGASNPDQTPTPYAIAKRWAADKVAQGKVSDVASRGAIQQYLRSARKAAADAETAMLADDIDGAFRHKQSQMLNNALAAEAKKAADAIEAAVSRLGKVAKKRTMKSIDQDYLEQAHALLEQVELRNRTQRSLDRQASFEAWATQRQVEGFDVVVPASFGEALGTTHWSRLTVERLLGLDAAVSQIMHLGRLKQKLIDGQDERDFAEVVGEAVAGMAGLPHKPAVDGFLDPSYPQKAWRFVLGIDAAMLKMETVFQWLDNGKPNGVFTRTIFQRFVDAQEQRRRRLNDIRAKLEAARQEIPEAIRKRWKRKVDLGLIDADTGRPAIMTGDQIVMLALNLGNEGNAMKLSQGYRWNLSAIQNVVDRELTVEEWQYVQKVWDIIDTLWPDLSAMERRVNGVAPEKVEAREVRTPHGPLRGGYFPVVYDPTRNLEVEKHASDDSDALFSKGYRRATTRAGSTNERTEFRAPILLSLSVIDRHVGEVIHDITHREAVIDANRFLNNPTIVGEIRETLGVEVQKQLQPWLRHIANEWASDAAGTARLEATIKRLRTNATFVGLAYRFSTMMLQPAGLLNTNEVIGPKWTLQGVWQFARNPIETTQFVLEVSQEVRARMETNDRDIRDAVRAEQSKLGFISNVKLFGFHAIGGIDRFVSVVSWIGAYNRALSEQMTERQAVAYADKVVRQSQGAGAAKDLAAIQRGKGTAGEASKLLTMFYSYMSAFYQRQRILGRDYATAVRERDVGALPILLARTVALYFLPALTAELLAGRGPEDDEDWEDWVIRTVGVSALGPIPIVRDVAGGVSSGFGYSFTPASGLGKAATNLWEDGKRIWEGEETKRATRNALEAVGYTTGYVPGQVAVSAQFLVDVAYGEEDPEGVAEWWRGLTKGKAKPEEK